MSADRLKQLAIALLVLLALWGVASVLRDGSEELGGDFEFPDFDPGALAEISLIGPADSIVIAKLPDGWRVNGYFADQDLVEQFVEQLGADDMSAELVSVNAASHERMGVAESNGTLLEIRGPDSTIGSVVAGERGPAFGTVYARVPGSTDTYLLEAAFASVLTRNVDDWRDRRILEADPDSIGTVAVRRTNQSYTLNRGEADWTFADGSPADSGAVARMVERYRSLRATGFAADTDRVDLARPDLIVELGDRAGGTIATLAFDSSGTDYWVRASEEGTVYQLAGWSVRQLAPADSLLRSDP